MSNQFKTELNLNNKAFRKYFSGGLERFEGMGIRYNFFYPLFH